MAYKVFGGPSRIRDEQPYITDIIHFSVVPTKIKDSTLLKMTLEDGLTSYQIAEKLGLSRSVVSQRLRNNGINKDTRKLNVTNPDNYLAPVAPFGYRKLDRNLVPYPKEIKICRLIITLINDDKPYRSVAIELCKRKIKNRQGNPSWSPSMVSNIYKRWSEKLSADES